MLHTRAEGAPIFCVQLFGVRVSVTFHLTSVHIIFSSVSVAEWPPFGQ